MRSTIALVAICASMGAANARTHPVADDPATAHFLANEAMMVSAGETRILFDPWFSEGFDIYPLIDPAIEAALLAGTPPYDGIDAVFISHIHGDHFDAAEMNAYLARHNEVIAVLPFQARLDMRAAEGWQDAFEPRLRVMPFVSEPQQISLGEVVVEAVHIPHAGGAARAHIQNMAYRVTLGDAVTVMHLGDATPDASVYALHRAYFQARATQRAFPPYWLIQQWGGETLRGRLNAETVTGIHVPIRLPGSVTASQEDFFTRPQEERGVHRHE